MARVFDRFWRADPSRQRSTGGTGLGLAISQEDAIVHGGELDVWSEPARGSCFRLTIPRHSGSLLGTSPLDLPPEDGLDLVRDDTGSAVDTPVPPARSRKRARS
jgi:two-component system sensor histidine kinase MtrB